MKDERNWLLRDALPQLQQFAVVNELQLQVVDLRWGASADMVTDPDCQPVYLEQIEYSRQYSAGPFIAVGHFVYFTMSASSSSLFFIITSSGIMGWINLGFFLGGGSGGKGS